MAADRAKQQAQALLRQWRRFWKPPPRLTLSQWADEHAYLSPESSAEPGKWRTIPYQRGIQDAFTDPTVEIVVCMKSARVGWTKILNNVVGYHVHQDPCPIMVVQPAVEDAAGYSKDEINPMLRDTPVLQGLVTDAKEKDGSNTILMKQFPGGTLGLVGANSGRGFRRVSRRVVLFDEASAYKPIPEGDQIKLGMRRADYYWNRKIGIGSTPILKGFDKTEAWWLKSDQRRYFVPCPACEHMQTLKWSGLKWEEGKPETVRYECEACGERVEHSRKSWMIERGEWRATATAERPGLVGFHIWAGYSYSPSASWENLVREFLEVKGDREQLQTFVNTVLGETFEDAYASQVGADGLATRRTDHPAGVCPEWALLLTCGVDVQDNRLAVSVWAWGVGETCMPVWHQELWGDPLQDEVWAQLDAVLESTWPVEGGGELRIVQLGLDTGGHATHEAYDWARERRGRGVLALKGSSRRGEQPIGKGKPQDVNRRGRLVKRGVTLYLVGTDTIKTTLYGRLRHNQPGTGGYVHLGAAADDEFLRQLTAERQAVRISKGFAVKEWIKRASDRNEALDCWVYAYAALQYVYRRMDRRTIWEQLKQQRALALPAAPGELPIGKRRRRSDGPAVELETTPAAAAAPADAAAPRPRRRRASSWL